VPHTSGATLDAPLVLWQPALVGPDGAWHSRRTNTSGRDLLLKEAHKALPLAWSHSVTGSLLDYAAPKLTPSRPQSTPDSPKHKGGAVVCCGLQLLSLALQDPVAEGSH
jgi:hypothetical protein